MRIAVYDDSSEDALSLQEKLKGQEVRIYSSATMLLEDLRERGESYDLYLLDIFIEGSIDGIELAKKLRKIDKNAVICFVSVSDAFYREAFDLYAVQYLLKPVQEYDLSQLLGRVSGGLTKDKGQSLCFKWRGQSGSIPYKDILYISSREHTISIYCTDGTVQACKGKLSEMAQQICGGIFLRCHQSFIVNIYQADSLSGKDLVICGQRIPISRRYYAQVKKRYQEILFEEVN
ncbi:MAG: response regulator transcription factor [Lachnospiraceae bacterium]|nr:response regulator transcription factor [Lachnospiraceae bacterium]